MGFRVPRSQGPSVQSTGLPANRLSGESSREAFGGGDSLQSAVRGTQALAGAVGEAYEAERQRANKTFIDDYTNNLMSERHRLTYDKDVGAKTKRGKDSFGIMDDFGKQFDTYADTLDKDLKNDEQRAMAARVRGRARMEFMKDLEVHTFQESRAFEEETASAGIVIARDDAITNYKDSQRISASLSRQSELIMEQSKRNGWSPEITKVKLEGEQSKTHASVIQRMLANGDDLDAKKYYDTNKSSLTGADSASLEKALEEGSTRGESQRLSDQITLKAGSMSDALKEARSIEDPKVRDATTDRIKEFYQIKRQADNEATENLFRQAGNIIDRTGSVDKIPPQEWSKFSVSEKAALKSYARHKREGTEPETNWQKYYDLTALASTDAGKAAFIQTNLMTVRHEMDNARFKELVELQNSLRKADGKSEAQLTGYRTLNQVVEDSLKAADIDDEGDKALFKRKVDEQVALHFQQTGKKAGPEDMQRFADQLLTKSITDRGWLWNSKDHVFKIGDDQAVDIGDIDDVPAGEVRRIREALKRKKRADTDEAIVDTYRKFLQGKKPGGK